MEWRDLDTELDRTNQWNERMVDVDQSGPVGTELCQITLQLSFEFDSFFGRRHSGWARAEPTGNSGCPENVVQYAERSSPATEYTK